MRKNKSQRYIIDKCAIIVIGGGSFQGKSLLSLRIAYEFGIPLIISTDTIRNTLHILHPNDPRFFTSTYLMTPENLSKQMEIVSDVIEQLITVWDKRGENVIIEGMHLSELFISSVSKRSNVLMFALNNQTPFIKRVKDKALTRKQIEYYDPATKKTLYGKLTDETIPFTRYSKYAQRIEEIHRQIIAWFRQEKLPVIDFKDLDNAINTSLKMVYNFMNKEK